MMETMFELRTEKGFCHLFDFFEEALMEKVALIARGVFAENELFITRVVTE